MDSFYQNLPQVYQTIEDKFNGWREKFPEQVFDLGPIPLTPILLDQETSAFWFGKIKSRPFLGLANGYGLKFRAFVIKSKPTPIEFSGNIEGTLAHHIEEDNESMLRKYGFTRENGFWVPKHRVIGLELVEGKIKVNPQGRGFTLTEDASENGTYQVKDIIPEMFQQLQNGEEFEQSYQRHLFWLGWLYHHPEIHVSIRRHGTLENPKEAISRMLLARIKDNVGEIFIGDLDNLVFDKA